MRTSSRDRILDGAETVVAADGVARLTLASAASRAGVSKGGVLYHFPTRASLVAAMVQRMADRFDADVEAAIGGDSSPGHVIRAYIEECFDAPVEPAGEESERSWCAVLAAVASEPALLQPLQESFEHWQRQVETDGLDPVKATVARIAADGLWLCELFGFAALTPEMRLAVKAELKAMVTP